MKTLTKQINNQTFVFSESKTLLWEEEKTLILSDMHLGKAAHFRKHGIAIPSEIMVNDLERLSKALDYFQPERMVIVGDFIHAGNNSDTTLFNTWREKHPQIAIDLVKGNHDRFKKEYLDEWTVHLHHQSLMIQDILFVHEPAKAENQFTISGHIHPGVSLKLQKNRIIRLPCWAFNDHQLILPAFSSFTGLDTNAVKTDFSKIIVTEGLLLELQ